MKNYVCNECNANLNTNSEYCTLCAPHMKPKEATMTKLNAYERRSKEAKKLHSKLYGNGSDKKVNFTKKTNITNEQAKQNAKDWYLFNSYLKEATNADEVYAVRSEIEDKHPQAFERHEGSLNKRCRNLAYKYNQKRFDLIEGSKEAKVKMQEAEVWLKEHGMLEDNLPMEKDVMAKQLGQDPKKTTYAEWEENCMEFYQFINACREASGENVSLYWRGSSNSNVSMEAENSDTKVDFIDSSAPVEKWGNLESALRLFTEGIVTGKQFDGTFRTSYFEEGLNAADTNHPDIGFVGTENAANKLRKMDENYTKNLVKSMEERTFRTMKRIENSKANIESWMEEAKSKIEMLVNTGKTRKYSEQVNVYEALRQVVRRETEYLYNMPFVNVKEVKFNGPVNITEALAALKDAKGANSLVIKELNDYKKELIAERFAGDFKQFNDVKAYIANLIEIVGFDDAVDAVKTGDIFSKQHYKNALTIASSRKNDCRFTKEEFMVLAKAEMVTRKKATKKKADQVSPATKELITQLKQGNMDVVTEDNAKEILKASYAGGDCRLPKDTYMFVKQMAS